MQQQAGGGDHEPDQVGAHEGHESVCIFLKNLLTQQANDGSQLLSHRWCMLMGERCLKQIINHSNYFDRSYSISYWNNL